MLAMLQQIDVSNTAEVFSRNKKAYKLARGSKTDSDPDPFHYSVVTYVMPVTMAVDCWCWVHWRLEGADSYN